MWEFIIISWLNGVIFLQSEYKFQDKQLCDTVQGWMQKKMEKKNETLPKDSRYQVTKCRLVNKGKPKGWSV